MPLLSCDLCCHVRTFDVLPAVPITALDQCGICGGNNKDLGCDGVCFSGRKADCEGVCGGNSRPDECGVCNGGNKDKDCSGVCFGKAFIDNSGACVLSSQPPMTLESLPVCGEEYAAPAPAPAPAPAAPTCGAPTCGAPAPTCGAPAPTCGAPKCGCAAPQAAITHEEYGPSWIVQVLLRVLFITLLGSAVGTAVIRYLLGKRLVADDSLSISYVKESMDPRTRNERVWAARRRAVRALCVITASSAALPNSDRPKAALAALVRLASPTSRGSVYLVFACGGIEAAVSIMAVCRSNAAVLTNVCTLLHELASTPSTVTRVRHHPNVANGKVPLAVLTVLRLFPSEPRAVEAASAALWSFAFASGGFIQTTLVRGDAHLDLMAAIVRFPTDVPVLYRACGALMALALRNPDAQKIMGEAGAAHLLMETLTAHRELNYGGDFSELRVWMRKYAAENPRPLLEGGAAASGGSNWWDIVRCVCSEAPPLPAFAVVLLPTVCTDTSRLLPRSAVIVSTPRRRCVACMLFRLLA